MAKLEARVGWRLTGPRGGPLDARVVDLVAAAARSGSLAAAARELAIAYRTAWALVDDAERRLGGRLLDLERGVGARPTALGDRLLAARERAARLIVAQAGALDVGLGARPAPAGALLRVAASHDLVLGELRDLWARRHRIALEFHGSAEALDLYRAGRADAAGFHVALGSPVKVGSEPTFDDPLLARLDPARDVVLPFVVRTQGFILPAGNPAGVGSFAGIARAKLRFVNRQPGSGTRIAIDRLLARERVEPSAIAGWTNEEFTHAAVAATIAAGRADAGFGIRAAAAQLGLAFVPVVDERYAFAIRRDALADPRIRAFRRLLASAAVAKVVAPMPGYRLDAGRAAGSPVRGASASRTAEP